MSDALDVLAAHGLPVPTDWEAPSQRGIAEHWTVLWYLQAQWEHVIPAGEPVPYVPLSRDVSVLVAEGWLTEHPEGVLPGPKFLSMYG